MRETYTIGLDYGTLSGRGVLVRCRDGAVLADAVKEYTHGVMDRTLPDGKTALPPGWCLEYPADYLEVLDFVVPALLRDSGVAGKDIVGIGIDFTSCTMLPVDADNVPLCQKAGYGGRRNAYAKLWKHHGAQVQADRINELLLRTGQAASPRFGGKISPELMAPKALETLEEDPELYRKADEILEAGDWVTRELTGSRERSCSMAGYKAWWNERDGYPDREFYGALHPGFADFARDKMPGKICPIGRRIGGLSESWADRLGLEPGTAVAPAVIDSHAGFPGSGICGEDQMMLVLGTSSVMAALSRRPYSEMGVCGGVKDALVPGYYALESGLAAVGDLFGWFTENMIPARYEEQARREGIGIHALLSAKAAELEPGGSGLVALDWWNGNKTPFVNGDLSGVLLGLTLRTRPEEIYRALIEATAFGTKRIMELYEKAGVSVREIVASGGISMKNPLLMQIYADVLGKPLKVAASSQAAALGSAIYAALAAGGEEGGYDSYEDAVRHMSRVREEVYMPRVEYAEKYKKLYALYCKFGKILGESHKELLLGLKTI
ncbi:MAG: ribulokinase [Eubacteriales bacterium]|nr:ribulokinase [Eubacteriales bacterium]